MTWLSHAKDFNSTAALLPGLSGAHRELYQSLAEQDAVPKGTLELCRLRLASLHRTQAQWLPAIAAISDARISALTCWPSHDVFTETDRACLDFAEVYAMDPRAITDTQAERVKDCVGERGLIVLIEALGILDGAIRLGLLWQLDAAQGQAS